MLQKDFRLLGNSLGTHSSKLSVLLRDNLYLAVNLLRSSPKISKLIKNSYCLLNLDLNDEKVRDKYFPQDFYEFLGL